MCGFANFGFSRKYHESAGLATMAPERRNDL